MGGMTLVPDLDLYAAT